MFKNLRHLNTTRSAKQAFGFYIVYLLILLVGGAIVGALAGLYYSSNPANATFNSGLTLGTVISIIYCLVLSFSVLQSKKLTNFNHVLLAILSGFLAFIGGGILGLIPAAYLTTVKGGQ